MTVSATPDTIERELIDFLETRTKAGWTVTRDLFGEGGLSSLFAMELVVHLEQRYGITITGANLKLANFRTVGAMVELVVRLRG
ncbi:acyl carrier protein [Umezawaea sp. Da 62-37]|uniref:acyl carrier protein n=1 Tax=Umezawaea sp. Da 62-37 TaxID=3075927 RepID=UPI0028F6F6F5|nr:acyl carrier protein [Umezawaea sp. Da 62-37]WNV86270.1 acyl carrier protein [Umezawaea sp. Da 62-37]